jgi:NAD(P)-binding Rossmann-like domain
VAGDSTLETDYLVVGAGALGMAFVDSLIEHSDADVVMVERRHRPGGHWLDSYPFVQLHQPSRFYGVSSTQLGRDRMEPDGTESDSYERASGAEICGYYDEIMRYRLLPSGRVRFFPMCDYLGDGRFRSRITDQVTDVTVRRRVVDATYMASRIPATDPAPFDVADGVRCVPVGKLSALDNSAAGYVIIGGGKTAQDAICWLLDRGADPDDITWIRPRDAWILNRAFFQPGQSRTLAGVVLQLEAMVESESIEEVYDRLEEDEVMLRTDRAVVPTMMKGGTASLRELEQLRRIGNVVRLGHIERIELDQIVLEQGSNPTTPQHLHVHCAASGLSDNPPRPIFTDDTITLQLVTRVGLTLSGALQGFLESTGRTTEEKNALCPPTVMPHTPFDYLRAVLAGISTEMRWQEAPELQEWVDRSRLNLLNGLGENEDGDAVRELQRRFFTALFPALDKLQVFAAQATPRERARMFDLGGVTATSG